MNAIRSRRWKILKITASLLWGIPLLALVIQAQAQGNPSASRKTGREIYREACATCHGIDGRGAAKSDVGFDLPLPDFSDCNFASREPDSDWFAIAHQGGPARAFSRLMPAFGEALSEEELSLALGHVRTFCGNEDWPRGELNLPRLLVTEKAFPEDEAVISSAINLEGLGAISNKIVYEQRFGARNQVELVIPFGWSESAPVQNGSPGSDSWRGGLGDIALGAKRTLFHSHRRGSIFSLAGEIVLPTGDRDKGFGKGTTVFEPFVSFGQILPSDFFVQSQAGLELPTDKERAENEGFWRFAAGRSWSEGRFGRSWSPMVELLGARELISGEKTQWDIVPQMQITLSQRQHIMFNVGVRLPLTDSKTRETQLMFYLLWDWFDGGLWEGWRK